MNGHDTCRREERVSAGNLNLGLRTALCLWTLLLTPCVGCTAPSVAELESFAADWFRSALAAWLL